MSVPPSGDAGRTDPLRGYRVPLDAEERVLLDLVRPGGPRLPDAAVRWPAVTAMARRHRLEPRLHRAARRVATASIPEAEREAWRRAHLLALHDNVLLLRQRDRTVRSLAQAGIRALVVKGAALADTLHGDPAVRPMGDVDLLLPHGAAAALAKLLPGLREAGVDLSRFEIEEEHHDLTMDGIYRLDLDALWRDALPAPFAPEAALVPSPADRLLLTTVSCCRNSFWNLVLLLDAAETLHRDGAAIDWNGLTARARAAGLDWALDTLLALTGMLLGCPAPAGARDALEPPAGRVRWIGRLLERYRLHADGGLEAVNIPLPLGPFALKYAVNRPPALLRQTRAVVLPDWRWMRAHYPRAGTAGILLRYAIHPFALAGIALRLGSLRRRGPGDAPS